MREMDAELATQLETTYQVGTSGVPLLLTALVTVLAACGGPEELSTDSTDSMTGEQSQALEDDERGGNGGKIIGVALEVENGSPKLLKVKAGQTFYINQIDLRATADATVDEGINGLRDTGDFSGLGWGGVKMVEQEPVLLEGPEGYSRRRFYREAAWMDVPSFFTVEPVDSHGQLTSAPIRLNAGSNDKRRDDDDFFVRRFRAIQWTNDCVSPTNCDGATHFLEEALVELRDSRTPGKSKTITLSPCTSALRVRWSLRPSAPYVIPVQQVAHPTYDYGFSIDVAPITPPQADGTYAPGTAVSFQLTLRDGSGKRLHPQGSLPTYNEVVVLGQNESGIQYYQAFFDPTATYYRRKHREHMLMTQIIGPAQNIQPIRSIIEMAAFLAPEDVQTLGTFERDGVFSQFQTFPPGNDLFGGAFDPAHAGWDAPVSDSWTYQLPANAVPGTYLVTVKGRRVYLGEDITLTTGPCNSCHSQGGELSSVLHGNDNRAACAGCHAPLGFELEGPVFVRVHFIHSRSDRFGADLAQCSKCHLNNQGIQRTSKAACLSCHKSYPEWHVKRFGPLQSMYVGGGRESFQQCTSTCHTTHPQSGL
jgi:hypothetical protein